jgi:hypothetical protein
MLMLTPLVAACDPGVAYLPQDWKKVNEVLFTQPISSDLALSTNGILILVGDRSLTMGLRIDNGSDHPVAITRAALLIRGTSFAGEFPSGDEWRTAKPHTQRNVSVSWKFATSAQRVLGDRPVLEAELDTGDGLRPLTVVLERQD